MSKIYYIYDILAEGQSIDSELRAVTDQGSDNVMMIKMEIDGKMHRDIVVAASDKDREDAMMRWSKSKVIVRVTKKDDSLVMTVLSVTPNEATPEPEEVAAPVQEPAQVTETPAAESTEEAIPQESIEETEKKVEEVEEEEKEEEEETEEEAATEETPEEKPKRRKKKAA